MKIKLDKKYKIMLIVISILLLFCITLGVSYAYWQLTHNQTGDNNLATGCFEVTFEETGNNISLKNTFPIIDQEGLELTPYKFKIKNTCTIDSEYYVTLNSLGNTNTLINENSIKYAFDLSTKKYPTPKILGIASENTETSGIDIDNLIKSYYLKGGYLRAGEEKEFSLYLWMDQDAPMSEMNKTFTSKIYITNVTTNNAPLIANLRAVTDGDATTNYLNGPLVKNTIEKIGFIDSNKVPADVIGSWDVSEQQNGAITAWYYDSDKNGKYEVYIGQEEGVIANSNSSYLFSYLENLAIIDVSFLDTSNVTYMTHMFYNTINLKNLDVSNWDTSKVITMQSIFNRSGITNLNLSNWNVSNVTNMRDMFYNCSNLSNLNLNSWNVSKVTNMYQMFQRCSSLTTLDLSKWDVSKVTTMYQMFYETTNLTNLNINGWNTSNVTSMYQMFYNSTSLTSLDLSSFNTSNVTDMFRIFYATGYNSTAFTLNLGNQFDTSKVTNMSYMFYNTGYNSTIFTLDLGPNFDTSNVTTMQQMFYNTGYSSTVFTLNLGDKFNTTNVTIIQGMFQYTGKNSLVFTLNLGLNFDTSKVTNFNNVFHHTGYSSTIFTLDLGDKFDTSNAISMTSMFSGVGRNSTVFTLNLGNKFNTSNVTTMISMFNTTGFSNSNFILDLRTLNFDKVTEWESMFYSSKTTHTAYVKNATDKTWISDKGFVGTIIDCSANTCL